MKEPQVAILIVHYTVRILIILTTLSILHRMTELQIAVDVAKREVRKVEIRTEAELARLEAENASHLELLSRYTHSITNRITDDQ